LGNFLAKLRRKWAGHQEEADLQEAIRAGERIETVVTGGAFQVLLDEILEPLREESYAAFKKVDPSDLCSVIQTQKIGWVVDEIKRRVERKIEFAREARQRIEDQKQPEEVSQ
jgi:hypothetical protein